MFNRLRRALGWTDSAANPLSNAETELPPEVTSALAGGRIDALQAALFPLMNTSSEPGQVQKVVAPVLRALSQTGWPAREKSRFACWAYFHTGQLQAAYDEARSVLTSGDDFDPDLFMTGCMAAYHANQFEAAAALMALGDVHHPALHGRPDAQLVFALIYWANAEYVPAIHAVYAAQAQAPEDRVVLGNVLTMSLETRDESRYRQTYAHLEGMLTTQGLHPETAFALGFCDLAEGRYRQGFARVESRYAMQEAGKYLRPELLRQPHARTLAELAGKRVLVTAEQGLGDTVMFARYLPALREVVAHLALEGQPEVLALLAYTFPWLTLYPLGGAGARAPFDTWVATMSLPHLLDTEIDTVPGTGAYLSVSPEDRAYWSARVAELSNTVQAKRSGAEGAQGALPPLRVGLTWSGSPTHRADRRRSIGLERLRPWIEASTAEFYVLQTTVPEALPDRCIVLVDEMLTLADTAALIEQLDVVLTIDTSVVHVAGAIGHPTLLMLPHRYEWRWGLEGPDNPWYNSVTVVRQADNGDWDSVLREVFTVRLPALVAARAA